MTIMRWIVYLPIMVAMYRSLSFAIHRDVGYKEQYLAHIILIHC